MRNEMLKGALTANAVFSGITGIGALASAHVLEEALGPPAWTLRGLAVGLVVFAAMVAREARSPSRAGTRAIIAADLAWVITAVAIVVSTPTWLTVAGRGALTAVTAVVIAVAAAQWQGLRTASSD